jgi:uncharacterized protein YdeI (YjbR/CyaY-like superfamily)
MKDSIKTFDGKSRSDWRRWLETNHQSENAVWLIIHHKKSGTKSVSYAEAVEEALCFGWVDSTARKQDDSSYCLFFAQRKPKSTWSKPNRERAAKMIAAKLMRPAGQAMIDLAKKSGTWDVMVEVENGVIPNDLQELFDKNKTAFKNFQSFAPSARKIILQWILQAKRPETRSKRIQETVKQAAKKLKAYP